MSLFKAPQPIVAGVMASNIASVKPFLLEQQVFVSVQPVWTGTSPVGVVNILVSNDVGTQDGYGNYLVTNWSPLATINVSGNAGVGYWQGQIAAKWFEVTYTATSGSGTLNVNCFCKSSAS